MIKYTGNNWCCPCGRWHRVRGIGAKIRKCPCGYKVKITTTYEKVYRLVSKIYKVEEEV